MSFAVAFLTTAAQAHNDNHRRLPRLFAAAGWRVTEVAHDALLLHRGDILLGGQPSSRFDLIWPIGLGPRQTFIDRQQLLALIRQERMITPAQAYLTLHGKAAWLHHGPATAIACAAGPLLDLLEAEPGEWVLKPVAGSFGKDVQRVSSAADVERRVGAGGSQYWMLQRFIPEITAGETRTLICDERIIGSYLRTPTRDFRANLAADGHASATELNAADSALVARVHAELIANKVGFAAIDTVGGYLMEVNIANPGGLQTLAALHGADIGAAVPRSLEARYRHA